MLNGGTSETLIFRVFKTEGILKAQSVIVTVLASLNSTCAKAVLIMLFWVPFSVNVYDHNRLFHIAAILIVGEQRSSYYLFLTNCLRKFVHWCYLLCEWTVIVVSLWSPNLAKVNRKLVGNRLNLFSLTKNSVCVLKGTFLLCEKGFWCSGSKCWIHNDLFFSVSQSRIMYSIFFSWRTERVYNAVVSGLTSSYFLAMLS